MTTVRRTGSGLAASRRLETMAQGLCGAPSLRCETRPCRPRESGDPWTPDREVVEAVAMGSGFAASRRPGTTADSYERHQIL